MYCTTTSVLDALSVTLNAVTVVGNHCDQDDSGVGDGGGLATLLLAGYERTKELRYCNSRVDDATYAAPLWANAAERILKYREIRQVHAAAGVEVGHARRGRRAQSVRHH